ncbi:hypothetical protein Ddc_07501 [Ditylenchus destructor]|nr:hypothetical protein Ddc_07501 [Ditylenchus destructor]
MSDFTGGFCGGFAMCNSVTDTINTNKYDKEKGVSASGAFLCEDDLMALNDNSFGGFDAGYTTNFSGRNGHNFKQNAISQQQKVEKNTVQNGWGESLQNNNQQQKHPTVNGSKAKVTSVDNGLQNNGTKASPEDKAVKDSWGQDGGWSCWDAEPASKDTLVGNIATASDSWADFDNGRTESRSSNLIDANNKRNNSPQQCQDTAKLSPFKSLNHREFVEQQNNMQLKPKTNHVYRGLGIDNRCNHTIDGDNTSIWFEHDDRDGNDGQKPEDLASPFSRYNKDVANPNTTPMGKGSGSQFGKIHVKQKPDKSNSNVSLSKPSNAPGILNEQKDQGSWETASFKGSSPGPSKLTENDNVSEWGGWENQNQNTGADNWNMIETSSWDNQPSVQASNQAKCVIEFPSTGPQPAKESKPTVSASPPNCSQFQKMSILTISTPPTTQLSDSPKPSVAPPFKTHNVRPFNMRTPPFETRLNNALSISSPNKQQQSATAYMPKIVQKRSPQAVPESLPQQSPAARSPVIVKKQSPQVVPEFTPNFGQSGTLMSVELASQTGDKKETKTTAGAACICNRLDARVICVTCGFEVEGRALKPCLVHPKRTCLTDRTSCGDAECCSTDIVEVPKRPNTNQ